MIQQLIRNFFKNEGPLRSSALTYTTLFAVVPFLTVSMTLLGLLPFFQNSQQLLESFVLKSFLPEIGTKIVEHLTQFVSQAKGLTGIGIIMLFFTSLMLVRNIELAFNNIWNVDRSRNTYQALLIYWLFVCLAPVITLLAIFSYTYLLTFDTYQITHYLDKYLPMVKPLPVILGFVSLTSLYKFLPNTYVSLKNAATGGILTALGFVIVKTVFTWLLTSFNSYTIIYGAYSAVPLFLIWIYISYMLILLGAEFVHLKGTKNES